MFLNIDYSYFMFTANSDLGGLKYTQERFNSDVEKQSEKIRMQFWDNFKVLLYLDGISYLKCSMRNGQWYLG